MAEAPGHRLGQIIGEALEIALEPVLSDFATRHDLYLDKFGYRPARPGSKVTWKDINGNAHDLDFVLERGGSSTKIGIPVAFIESAWRRYSKHSRNKAQEIQGAVEPLIKQWANVKPLGGAIIGGVWTAGARTQLTSLGFAVAYIQYDEVVAAFRSVGIDVATDESTTDAHLAAEVAKYGDLSDADRDALGEALRATAPEQFRAFEQTLERAVSRTVSRVSVVALHGLTTQYASIEQAVNALETYTPPAATPGLVRWEIVIDFTNDDRIQANFRYAHDAIGFMNTFS